MIRINSQFSLRTLGLRPLELWIPPNPRAMIGALRFRKPT